MCVLLRQLIKMDQEKSTFDTYIHRVVVWRRKKRMSIIMLVVVLLVLVLGMQFYIIDQKGLTNSQLSEKVRIGNHN